MRSRIVIAGLAVALGVVLVVVAPRVGAWTAAPDRVSPPPSALGADPAAEGAVPPAVPPEPPPPRPAPGPVSVDTPGYWSWAYLDRATAELYHGPEPTGTSSTESMIKVWLVADTLRRYAEPGGRPPRDVLDRASAAIRVSDDEAAESLYRAGGGDEMIRRLVETCDLTHTTLHSGWWSRTTMTAADAVRMGLCIADGRAAGPEWTEWVLAEMRQVRGTTAPADQPHGGRWGIIEALPPDQARQLSIKNGWTPIWADGAWHISCLAIADGWVLAVQARYPIDFGLDHGAGVCREVARQVLR